MTRAALVLVLVAGCTRAPSAVPAPRAGLAVEVTGCAEVRADATCLVRPPATLTVFVDDAAPRFTGGAATRSRDAWTVALDDDAPSLAIDGADGARRFTLALARAPASPLLDDIEAKKRAGQLDEALALLAHATLSGVDGARAAHLRGRIARQQGHVDDAIASLRAAVAGYRAAGSVSGEVDASFALAYTLIMEASRFDEAAQVLALDDDRLALHGEGRAFLPYYRGVLATETGDIRGALADFDEAERRLTRLALPTATVRQQRAAALARVGRADDALVVVRALAADASTGPPCARAWTQTNLGWALLRAGGAEQLREAVVVLTDALAAAPGCASPAEEANILVNLALALERTGDVTAARARLREVAARLPAANVNVRVWALEVDARLLLREGHAPAALARFDALATRARAASLSDARFRAAVGRAEVLEQLARPSGDRDAALAAYADAEALLRAAALLTPLFDGRDSFLAEHERLAARHVALLLAVGRTRDAFDVARRARARLLSGLMGRERLASLRGDGRARFIAAVGAYRRERALLDAEAARDWRLPADAVHQLLPARAARQQQLAALLDDAYVALAPPHGEDAPSPLATPGELTLLAHPLATGWVVFASLDDTLAVSTIDGAMPVRDATALSAALLAPFSTQLARAQRLRFLAYGPLQSVDVHALPWDGDVLLARLPVVYGLDLPPLAAVSTAGGTLAVVDPRGDLPGARAEVPAHAGARVLAGDAARRDDVVRELAGVARFHYAGHARFSGRADSRADSHTDSGLLLADGATLTVADVLALERAPREVVLAACESAAARDDDAETLGIAPAFLVAGSSTVLASVRPLRDDVALRIGRALWRAPASDTATLDQAARAAVLELARAEPSADWASFRVLVR